MVSGRRGAAGERGFTLLELMIVVGIISTLAGMAFPMVLTARKLAVQRLAMTTMRSIYLAEQDYHAKHETYASTLDQLASENMLPGQFRVGVIGPQQVGSWLYDVVIPDPSTANPPITDPVMNQVLRVRVTAMPAGVSAQDRMAVGSQDMIMLETTQIYVLHFDAGYVNADVVQIAQSAKDTDFGTVYPLNPLDF